MSETILTIPINDLFRPKCGCPICRMEEQLEEQGVQYITGVLAHGDDGQPPAQRAYPRNAHGGGHGEVPPQKGDRQARQKEARGHGQNAGFLLHLRPRRL